MANKRNAADFRREMKDPTKPIVVKPSELSTLARMLPWIDLERIKRFFKVRLRFELVTPERAEFYRANEHPNRKGYKGWTGVLVGLMKAGEWTLSMPVIWLCTEDRLITGGHTCDGIKEFGKPMLCLVLCGLNHDEVAEHEGHVRAQRLYDRVYRAAKILNQDRRYHVTETAMALIRSGIRTSGMSAKYNVKKLGRLISQNISWLERIAGLFTGGLKWTNRAPVRAAFARVYPHIRPVDMDGAAQVLCGRVKAPSASFDIFAALQNEIICMQGCTKAASEAEYFYATLHAWAVYLGLMRGKKAKPVISRGLKVASAQKLKEHLGTLSGVSGKSKVQYGMSRFRMPELDYQDPAVQQQLLDLFPWTKAAKCGLAIP